VLPLIVSLQQQQQQQGCTLRSVFCCVGSFAAWRSSVTLCCVSLYMSMLVQCTRGYPEWLQGTIRLLVQKYLTWEVFTACTCYVSKPSV
jgi:hypothetical protein